MGQKSLVTRRCPPYQKHYQACVYRIVVAIIYMLPRWCNVYNMPPIRRHILKIELFGAQGVRGGHIGRIDS